ncbi:HU family DNA-binding protein [Leptolyngbyaceae cyanobacterium CCMR0082]|uniref:HU family DNA-binding protein n=2 Tax=Adonisia turfae TaxID=2950184 RepID=A0A6M0S531_9CYAN|nr:HU family DNA-binding protein [Adonisia turfae]MDV3348320.1 HU family DNA-binding protein [Leptothoe sp. LEGE 181152]NEZ56971.1 HU family DNA-binding protein [Adonisia turfae CCMR0081]NEZ63548.1 HU family DNA-binding protein [Adonisia turfae CCMR0082]
MNKGELIDAISTSTDLPKSVIDTVVSATVDTVVDTVANGEKVTLVGFGSFEPRDRKARDGRNPKTGEVIKIPATTIPAFSAGKAFKERVKNP